MPRPGPGVRVVALTMVAVVLALYPPNLVHTAAADGIAAIAHGGAACSSDWDCSLGGECDASTGTCNCDPWFTGARCALLNLQKAPDTQAGTCGDAFDGYYSWGGRTVHSSDDGLYHLFASFMCNHNSLRAWTTVSASAHLVSPSPIGPFEWAPQECNDTTGVCAPMVIPWAHNTVVMESAPGQSPALTVWHVGNGIAPVSDWYPCFVNSSASSSMSTATPRKNPAAHVDVEGRATTLRAPPPVPGPGNMAFVATADSPYGPWSRAFDNKGAAVNTTGSWTPVPAGNFAPLRLANGTVLLYFTGSPCPAGSGALATNCIAVAVGDRWTGPFQMHAAQRPITYPESEDPNVWVDPRGNYHLLTNVNTCHRRCNESVPCGGHAWGTDGVHFTNLTIGAFGPLIPLANGTTWTNAYAERPLVTQQADGSPLAFHVGLGRSTYTDSCNWVQLFCTTQALAAGRCAPTVSVDVTEPWRAD